MDDAMKPAVPGWFWIVAAIALLWEGLGCYAYLMQISTVDDATPMWVTASFAVAVWVGVVGALLLLMRQKMARSAFAVSLLAVIVQLAGMLFVMKPQGGQPPVIYAAVAIGAVLLWFSDMAAKRGWLR
ncbi:MAG: hypothetical protein ACJ8DZ_03530 [Allosphingosinicella sp.]